MIRPLWVLTLQMGGFNKAINLNSLLYTQTPAFFEYTKQKRTAFKFMEIGMRNSWGEKNRSSSLLQVGLFLRSGNRFQWLINVGAFEVLPLLNLKGETMSLFVWLKRDKTHRHSLIQVIFACFCLFSYSFVV